MGGRRLPDATAGAEQDPVRQDPVWTLTARTLARGRGRIDSAVNVHVDDTW